MWTDPITWATVALLVAPFAVLELRRHRRHHAATTRRIGRGL